MRLEEARRTLAANERDFGSFDDALEVVLKRLAELEARDAAMSRLIEQAERDGARFLYMSHIRAALNGGA